MKKLFITIALGASLRVGWGENVMFSIENQATRPVAFGVEALWTGTGPLMVIQPGQHFELACAEGQWFVQGMSNGLVIGDTLYLDPHTNGLLKATIMETAWDGSGVLQVNVQSIQPGWLLGIAPYLMGLVFGTTAWGLGLTLGAFKQSTQEMGEG